MRTTRVIISVTALATLLALVTGCGNTSISSDKDDIVVSEKNTLPKENNSSNENDDSIDEVQEEDNSELGDVMEKYKITFQEDENVDFWGVYDGLYLGEGNPVEEMPTDLTKDDFVGYLAYSGYASDDEAYAMIYEDGFLMAYYINSEGAKQKRYVGIVENDEAFISKINSLEYKQVKWAELDGEDETYGVVYFKKNDKLYYCFTEDIFPQQ